MGLDVGDWISIFMALIAIASIAITYNVYRSSTDPEVIVYADIDLARPSIVNLIIKNIGKGAALDITFNTNKPLPEKAMGIDGNVEMPSKMTSGPIVVGVPYLAPNQQLTITWGQYGGLKKYLGSQPIIVTSRYKRSKSLRGFPAVIESISKLDIQSMGTAESSDHHWGGKLVVEMRASRKELAAINESLANLKQKDS
ncbi:hypothetical protein [Catenovulum agarivorans]|uniref:hypothetical protein n=1 Tax=Catenovulum agarivorans TaxID=1172192 RepID=UPI0002DFF878|nr:hypothetical protein [Catenovulum agarivorans]